MSEDLVLGSNADVCNGEAGDNFVTKLDDFEGLSIKDTASLLDEMRTADSFLYLLIVVGLLTSRSARARRGGRLDVITASLSTLLHTL